MLFTAWILEPESMITLTVVIIMSYFLFTSQQNLNQVKIKKQTLFTQAQKIVSTQDTEIKSLTSQVQTLEKAAAALNKTLRDQKKDYATILLQKTELETECVNIKTRIKLLESENNKLREDSTAALQKKRQVQL